MTWDHTTRRVRTRVAIASWGPRNRSHEGRNSDDEETHILGMVTLFPHTMVNFSHKFTESWSCNGPCVCNYQYLTLPRYQTYWLIRLRDNTTDIFRTRLDKSTNDHGLLPPILDQPALNLRAPCPPRLRLLLKRVPLHRTPQPHSPLTAARQQSCDPRHRNQRFPPHAKTPHSQPRTLLTRNSR